MKYLIVMANSWGTGDSISEAEKRARAEGHHGRKKMKRLCYKYDPAKTPNCYISDMGYLCWTGDQPEQIEL